MEYRVHRSLVDYAVKSSRATSPYKRMIQNYRFKPNATKNKIMQMYRSAIKEVPDSWSEIAAAKAGYLGNSDELMWKIQYSPALNAVGKAYIETSIPPLTLLVRQKHRSNISVSATQLFFALKCYKLDHGDLPESLDELVPDYIDEIPIDDFDGKPLRYSKEKKIIYSVGPDMEDSGGKRQRKPVTDPSDKHFWLHDDDVFKIDF